MCECDCCGLGCGKVKCPYCIKGTDSEDYCTKKSSCLQPDSENLILKRDTVILHHDGLRALKFFLDKRPNQEPSTSVLVRLAELVLTLNYFSFDGEHYQQISGVAMGTKMGPNYANLFVGFVEKQIFEQYTDPIPDYLGRYIDDCVGTASCSRGKLECFINYVNNFHPALQFTWEISETSVSFLDILVSINGNRLTTSVFYKPTDSHSYLLYSSSYPNHTKQSIPFSQFLRLRRLCSEDEDFQSKSLEMRQFFVQRWLSHLSFRYCLFKGLPNSPI